MKNHDGWIGLDDNINHLVACEKKILIYIMFVLKPHYPLYDKKKCETTFNNSSFYYYIITFQISKPHNIFIIPPRIIPPTKKIK